MALLEAFKRGNIQQFSHKRLVFILWILNLMAAFLVSIPVYFIIDSFAGYSLTGKELIDGISILFIIELIKNNSAGIVGIISLTLLAGVFYIITGVFAYPLDKTWLGREIDNSFVQEVTKLKQKYKIHQQMYFYLE